MKRLYNPLTCLFICNENVDFTDENGNCWKNKTDRTIFQRKIQNKHILLGKNTLFKDYKGFRRVKCIHLLTNDNEIETKIEELVKNEEKYPEIKVHSNLSEVFEDVPEEEIFCVGGKTLQELTIPEANEIIASVLHEVGNYPDTEKLEEWINGLTDGTLFSAWEPIENDLNKSDVALTLVRFF